MLRRIELFRSATGTRKGILPTLVTTGGLKHNANAAMITNVVTLDDIFRCRRRSRAAVRYRSLSEECGVAVIGFDEL